MSTVAGEKNTQDDHRPIKCRIPRRLPIGRQKNALEKNKSSNYSEVVCCRPKSANRATDNTNSQGMNFPPKSARTEREKLSSAQKKPTTGLRKAALTDNILGNKTTKQIITVPLANKQKLSGGTRTAPIKNFSTLPDQETIKRCEDLETQQDEQTESPPMYQSLSDLNEKDSVTSRREKIMHLKMNWQETIVNFENMKNDLNNRQRVILAVYASLQSMHKKLSTLGHKSNLPPADDLQIMNVANLTPDQLLQLCSESKRQKNDNQLLNVANNPINHYINRMSDMPKKLIDLCQETLIKRKEIIDWFDTLKNQEQGVTVASLRKKIYEFNAENQMLSCSLEKIKSDIVKELNEIFDFLRLCVKETITLQLRTEELTCLLSDENSKNTDLRKQINNAAQCRSHNNIKRITELERLLKDEKLMKGTIQERLYRAEGQVKIGEERAVQLEAALNQAQAHTRNLERTIQHLNDENHKLQLEFEEELSKLNQLILENTTHLEEIGDAREKLQSEKEDLEKRLEELSSHYNESLDNIKEEQKRNVTKIIEIENKYYEELEERKKCDKQIEALCAQLVEAELRHKDTVQLLEDQKLQLSHKTNELHAMNVKLDKRNAEIEECHKNLSKQNETIKQLESSLAATLASEEKTKNEVKEKGKLLAELKLEKKTLKEELQNRDFKMSQYEDQLSLLKNHILELQKGWTNTENIQFLPEMVKEQNTKIADITRQKNELEEYILQKNIELEKYFETIKEQKEILDQKENIIKMLSDKEQEQENIIRLLKNNLEMRAQVDSKVNQHLLDKNDERVSLKSKLEVHKKRIHQLERIVLNLEEKLQKSAAQIRKYEDKICTLEKHIAQYEAYNDSDYKREMESPAENLDNLIKILEEELNSPIVSQSGRNQEYHNNYKKRNYSARDIDDVYFRGTLQSDDYKHRETVPTKIKMGNFIKKTYEPNINNRIQSNERIDNEHYNDGAVIGRKLHNFQLDNFERVHTPKFLVTNRDILVPLDNLNTLTNPLDHRQDHMTKNLHYIVSNHLREEKKRKIFKLAGHRL